MKWKCFIYLCRHCRQAIILFMLVVSVYPTAANAEEGVVSKNAQRAMDELWRRGSCLGCVQSDAKKAVKAPAEIGDVKIIKGRLFGGLNPVRCYLIGKNNIWLGTDSQLYQVSIRATR